MTRTTIRMKIALAVALAATGLAGSPRSGSSVRRGPTSRTANQAGAKAAAPAAPKNAVWSIEGIVVDEQGRPVAGCRRPRGRAGRSGRAARRPPTARSRSGWDTAPLIPGCWSPKPMAAHESAWPDSTRPAPYRGARTRCGSS